MCFSPEADLVGGSIVGLVGIDALRHVERPRQLLLGVMPLLLAAHEIDEAFVWWRLQGRVSASVGQPALYAYLAFAFALPVIVPLVVLAIESDAGRRRAMETLLALGIVVSLALESSVVGGAVNAHIEGHHITYAAVVPFGLLLAVLYVVITCGSLLLSSDQRIAIFGATNVVAVIVLAWIATNGLTSLWCGWAAAASVAIALYLRQQKRSGAIQSVSPVMRPSF